jgi:hypothetical protein
MKEKYQSIQVHVGKVLPFLGMLLDFSVVGSVRLSMQPYIEDILDECIDIYNASVDRDNRAHSTPASIGLFDNIDNDSPYLAKKVRPDILTAVSFLSTRVQRPTTQDNKKLVRVLKYIKGTKNLGIVISPSKKIAVDAYIDASFTDAKSHSGLYITMGKGPIFYRSAKQKIVTKSSTEAELVALISDESSHLLWCRYFLQGQDYKLPPSKIFEDNLSTISLLKKDAAASTGASRTKHISVKYFYIRERMQDGDIDMKYLNTHDMIADILTKPLQGEAFRRLRSSLLNWI